MGTALLGAWTFNALATRYLLAHPPHGHDLATIADNFETFVAGDVSESGVFWAPTALAIPKCALVEAIRIDVAHRRVTTARATRALSQLQPNRLAATRLVPSPTVVLIDEHWPLVALRRELSGNGDRPVVLPAPHPTPQTWAIARTTAGFCVLRLEPLQAKLLRQLSISAIADALAIVEAECAPKDVEVLIAGAPGWLAQSVELGMWSSTVEARP